MLHMAGMASTIHIQFSTNIQVDLKIGTLQLTLPSNILRDKIQRTKYTRGHTRTH